MFYTDISLDRASLRGQGAITEPLRSRLVVHLPDFSFQIVNVVARTNPDYPCASDDSAHHGRGFLTRTFIILKALELRLDSKPRGPSTDRGCLHAIVGLAPEKLARSHGGYVKCFIG